MHEILPKLITKSKLLKRLALNWRKTCVEGRALRRLLEAAADQRSISRERFLTQTKLRIHRRWRKYMKSKGFPKLKTRMRSFAKTSFSCNSHEAGQWRRKQKSFAPLVPVLIISRFSFMLKAGMDIVCFNFSHGSHSDMLKDWGLSERRPNVINRSLWLPIPGARDAPSGYFWTW